jgi:hypothetical protein
MLYTSSIYALHPFFEYFRACENLFVQLHINGVIPKGEGDVDKKRSDTEDVERAKFSMI